MNNKLVTGHVRLYNTTKSIAHWTDGKMSLLSITCYLNL